MLLLCVLGSTIAGLFHNTLNNFLFVFCIDVMNSIIHESLLKVKRQKRERMKLKLTKQRFKKFKKDWDNLPSDEASEEFDRKLVSQGRESEGTVLEADIEREGSESADESIDIDGKHTVEEVDGDIDDEPPKRQRLAKGPGAEPGVGNDWFPRTDVPLTRAHLDSLDRTNARPASVAASSSGLVQLHKFDMAQI